MKRSTSLLLALLAAAIAAGGARANGDPASDVLPFTTVYLSIKDPKTMPAGRDLLAVTTAAAKQKRPIRIAVIAQQTDLGLIQSMWKKPQTYAHFLGEELKSFGRYSGTLIVAMPNGFGIHGPDAAKGTAALARLPEPGTSALDKLGTDAANAARKVAVANGYTLPPPSKSGSGTPGWMIVLAALGGAAVIAGTTFVALRRWLTQP